MAMNLQEIQLGIHNMANEFILSIGTINNANISCMLTLQKHLTKFVVDVFKLWHFKTCIHLNVTRLLML